MSICVMYKQVSGAEMLHLCIQELNHTQNVVSLHHAISCVYSENNTIL